MIGPFFVNYFIGKALSIIGLALLTIQTQKTKSYNLSLLNAVGICGYLYSIFTQLLGFNFDSDEYKIMGLAPYGSRPINLDKIILSDKNGNYSINKSIINKNYKSRQSPLYNEKIYKYLNIKKKFDSKKISNNQKNIAASVQKKLEDIIIQLVQDIYRKTKIKKICFAGGVSLNCAALRKISNLNIFDDIFVQPASSDAGTSIGAAFLAYLDQFKNTKIQKPSSHVYLGNEFKNNYIKKILEVCNLNFENIYSRNKYNFLLDEIAIIKLYQFLEDGMNLPKSSWQ